MQTKRSKVFTTLAKSPILNVSPSSEYGYSVYSVTDFMGMKTRVRLNFHKFC